MLNFKEYLSENIKKSNQVEEQAVAVAGMPGATSISGGGIAGINPGEIPPVGKGITTAGHMLRRLKPKLRQGKNK